MEQLKEQQIFKAMASILEESEAIGKDQINKDQKFNFRGIDDVYNSLHSLLGKHKVFTVPTVLDRVESEFRTASGTLWKHVVLKISYKFYTTDGSFVEAIMIGEGRDSSDKGSNKAMAIAHKYALLQVFCIPTKEEKDPDFATVENAKETPKVEKKSEPVAKTSTAKKEEPKKEATLDHKVYCYSGKNKGKKWSELAVEDLLNYEQFFKKKATPTKVETEALQAITAIIGVGE